jgi:FKBP-type peptidyl-prolyl cis-trans isomerase SlyD
MTEPRISLNQAVYITYVIHDAAQEVLEQVDLPVGYVHGANSGLFEKLEQRLEGCAEGDRVEVTLTPKEAFGEIDPGLIFVDDMVRIPPEYCRLGAEVPFQSENGEQRNFVVTKIEHGKVTIDGNHLLAGKTLTFNVRVNRIRPATTEEIAAGRPLDVELPGTLH